MTRRLGPYLVVLLTLCACVSSVFPCTSFVISESEGPVFGRNLDYHIGYGMAIVNKRGVEKTAVSSAAPAQWVSKYGSVTFNTYGREMPMGGMNEAGLVVENMWLDATQYPPDDSTETRPTVNSLQWIQYQLDTAGTVKQVIESDAQVRILDTAGTIHFLICDAGGDCAVIEFLNGVMVVHRGEDLPVRVLTNSTYESSVDFLRRFDGNRESDEYLAGSRTFARFVTAADMVDSYESKSHDAAIDRSFEILEEVSFQAFTRWSIVYDIANDLIYFRTKTNPERRSLDLSRLDFACGTTVMVHDLDAQGAGDITGAMEAYSFETNRALIMKAFGETEFLKDTPVEVLEMLARYPETLPCSQ